MSRRKKNRGHKVTLPDHTTIVVDAHAWADWSPPETEELTGDIDLRLSPTGGVEMKKTVTAEMDVHIANLERQNANLRAAVRDLRQVARNAHAARRAESILDWLQVIVPMRLNKEDIGDAVEQIHGWAANPTCRHVRAKIAIKVISTVFFASLNAIRFVVASMTGKKTD